MVWGWGIISLALATAATTVSTKMYPPNCIKVVNQVSPKQFRVENIG
jgi:hypothetical protein